MGNWFKTMLLLGIMTALIVWIGNLFGGRQGMILAFILAMSMNFFSYWFSDRIVLKMYRAQEVTLQEQPELHQMVAQIARQANLPVPRIFVIPERAPNAFATGRDPEHAVVAVTEGLLNLMNREEVMGVLSHEMAHVKNRDILIGSIAATLAGAVMILANMARWTAFLGGGRSDDDEGGGGLGFIGLIVMSILAPLAAMLIQMAVSRSREYLADQTGAGFIGKPLALATALEKLGTYSKRIPMHAEPNTAHMFIVHPLIGARFSNLFSTHPPLEDRIRRLRGAQAGSLTPPPPPDKNRGLKEAQSFWDKLKR